MADPALYLFVLLAGAFAAAFVIGAIGFADALILNAVWLHIMAPADAVPLIVICGIAMHAVPLYRLRHQLDFSRLGPFLVTGLLGVPVGIWALEHVRPDHFKLLVACFLVAYGVWMLARPKTSLKHSGGKLADSAVGLAGGFMGGFAGLSGLLPTLWSALRAWPKATQRGVYQPFIFVMHVLALALFSARGLIDETVAIHFVYCAPVIMLGTFLGSQLYPHINETLFRRTVLLLILASGIALFV